MRQTNQKSNKLHYILYIAPLILSLFILSNNTVDNTSALEYQSNTNVEFTLNPTISVSVSDDLVIDNLSPGTASDSNIVNVNVATNNVTGYVLSATVGNTNNPTTRLTHITNSNYKFTSTSTNTTELSNLEPNTWGYNYSTDNGANWHNYSTLPLYTTTGTTLNSATTASNDTIKFKIGAKASNTQASGTYTNTINFYATTNQSPTSFYDAYKLVGKELYNGYYTLQDMSHTICTSVDTYSAESVIELIDTRDNQLYTVAKLYDDNCWMIDNLNLGDLDNYPLQVTALNSTNTNIDTNTEIMATDFTTWEKTAGTATYTEPEYIPVPGTDTTSQTSYGTLYNYCAASAGTICASAGNNSLTTTHDVCPTGWKLPIGSKSGKFQALYNNINYNTNAKIRNSLADGGAAFALAGDFLYGVPDNRESLGHYWSSTRNGGYSIYDFRISTSDVIPNDESIRSRGYSIRCLAK